MLNHRNLEGVNRGNYTPDPSEKHLVHYKAELPRHNNKTGAKESHPELLKTGVKMFDGVKRDLEKQGYIIEILYHPLGKYNTPIPTPKVDERDAEIAALKAELEALKGQKEAVKEEVKEEEPIDLEEKPTEEATKEEKPKAKKTTKKTKK